MTISSNYFHDSSLTLIFSHLSLKELGCVAQVSKKWNEISSSDQVWQHFQLYENSSTRSPIKFYTVLEIHAKAIPALNQIKQIPSTLPTHHTVMIFRFCCQ